MLGITESTENIPQTLRLLDDPVSETSDLACPYAHLLNFFIRMVGVSYSPSVQAIQVGCLGRHHGLGIESDKVLVDTRLLLLISSCWFFFFFFFFFIALLLSFFCFSFFFPPPFLLLLPPSFSSFSLYFLFRPACFCSQDASDCNHATDLSSRFSKVDVQRSISSIMLRVASTMPIPPGPPVPLCFWGRRLYMSIRSLAIDGLFWHTTSAE